MCVTRIGADVLARLLAPFHLIVLQNLVLSASFPEPLLAINGEAIARLVAPSTGLGPVLQSSNFDVVAIMSKLQAAKISNVIRELAFSGMMVKAEAF